MGKMIILVVKLMDFFIELYLSCVGIVFMFLVMIVTFVLKMW